MHDHTLEDDTIQQRCKYNHNAYCQIANGEIPIWLMSSPTQLSTGEYRYVELYNSLLDGLVHSSTLDIPLAGCTGVCIITHRKTTRGQTLNRA